MPSNVEFEALVFFAVPGLLTLRGLNMTNGLANGNGGAIRRGSGATLRIENSGVTNSHSNRDGGGVYSFGPLELVDSVVSGNTTEGGGSYGGIYGRRATLVTRSIVSENRTDGFGAHGGGIRAFDLTLVDSTVSGNSTSGINARGGGIYANDFEAINSTISGNSTSGDGAHGGGILVGTNDVVMTNCTVSDNTTTGASANGGGVFDFRGSITLNHTTMTDNVASGVNSVGGGLFQNSNGTMVINHSIIAGNTASGGADDFHNRIPFEGNHSLFGELQFESNFGPGNSFGVDPMLEPLADNGGPTMTHEPQSNSPAIGSGDPAITGQPGFDQRGNTFERVVDTIDIGSFEVQPESLLDCDFDGDGICAGSDIDALQANIVSGPADPATFDLTGDGLVTVSDRGEWLALAGAENLASGNAYLLGDANLDGVVDVSDFNVWNRNKFSDTSAWTAGDFSVDGAVDVSDFNIWNRNKFQASDSSLRRLSQDEASRDEASQDEGEELEVLDVVLAGY